MDLRLSSPKIDLSLSDSVSDPEEKEITDDDDDDRNHKHRRQETQSQSLERDSLEQVLVRSGRNLNKPFENGHSYREANSQSNETWRNYSMPPPLEKDLSGKVDRRRPGIAPVSRAPFDLNQRTRTNQLWSGDSVSGRGRGREPGSWSQRDSRFSSVDIIPQMVQQGPVHSSLFAGRGMPAVSNAQNASWSAFGWVPGLPNGGLDPLHSLALQRTLRAPINPGMNIGVPRERCRDFEEQGFCLRGDMCPMEHGVNRIVVEDVQSLSQFNLPVSLPSARLLGGPAGPELLSAVSATSSTLANGTGLYGKSSKSRLGDDGLGSNGDFIGSSVTGGADLYDPDQPLWTKNDGSQASTGLLDPTPSKADGHESLLDADPSEEQHIRLYDDSDNERPVRSNGTAVGSHSTSLSRQIRSSKNITEARKKIDSRLNSSSYTGNTFKEDPELLKTAHQLKQTNADDINPHALNIRKPSQKAQCTLFVNHIPPKDNRREALLSHFRKFGEVINIYIPLNSDRAFVQFSKRKEADDALKAPDAVMGNRFIKLFWANRDNIPDDGMSSIPIASRAVAVVSDPDFPTVANEGKDTPWTSAPKGSIVHASVSPVLPSDRPKPVVNNGSVAPTLKKMENLEFLKEELRKKQEMLDQKRNDFRRKLDKLEKQATGLKGEVALEQAPKRHKVEKVADAAEAATPISIDPGTVMASPHPEMMTDSSRSGEYVVPFSSKTSTMVALQDPSRLKQSIRPLASAGAPFALNRFKLDNRPTSFKIIPPLPTGLANVSALKEHFLPYGELSSVDVEDSELEDGGDESVTSRSSACIYFTTRHSAEKAFSNGKCWKGHNMQFIWLTTSCNCSKENSARENASSSDANGQPAEKISVSEDGESEVSERRDSGTEQMAPDEELHASFSGMSPEKKSTQGDVSLG